MKSINENSNGKTLVAGLSRRRFLGATALGAAAAFSATALSKVVPNAALAASKPSASANPCADDRKRFKYFGPDANVRNDYHKFLGKPATVIDFGLTPGQEDRARQLHKTLLIFDGIPEVGYYDGLLDDLLRSGCASPCGSYTIDALPHDVVNGLEKDLLIRPEDWWARQTIDDNLAFMDEMVKYKGNQMMICTSYADLMKAKETGKVGMMLDCQNTQFIRNDMKQIEIYYGKGVRRIQLSYNQQMQTATGCMEPRDGGVTKWGARVIGKLNEVGMMVDVAHCSSLTLLDAIDISEKPITCSHAGMRAIAPDNPRTHTDEGLKKLADNGGLYGVVGVPGTLVAGSETATVGDFVNALDRAVNLMGIDNVGFSTDQPKSPSLKEWFTSPDWPPEAAKSVNVSAWPWTDMIKGMENQSGYLNLTRGLVAKGYSDGHIGKIMGGNWLRFIKEVIG